MSASRGKAGKGSQTVRRGKAKRPKAAPRRASRGPGLMQRLLDAQPLPPIAIRRIAISVFVVALALGAWQVGAMTGVNAYVSQQAVDGVGRAGFSVKRIQVVGANKADRDRIYEIALAQQDRSMAAFDLAEVRRDLLRYGWVGDARVSRRLPDTLVIDLVERQPVAVWQDNGRYTLIDQNGVQLPGVNPASMPDLPVIVGHGANRRMVELGKLLDAAPALRPQLAGASWVGNRRWDLRFKTGEVLALPEDEEEATTAFSDFARMDGVNRLLGRGLRRIDMRISDRLVLRPGRDGDLGDLGLVTGTSRTTVTDPAPRTTAGSEGG